MIKPKLEMIRGDSFSLTIDAQDDIAGATVYFTAKSEADDATTDTAAILQGETTLPGSPAVETATISWTATETNELIPGDYLFDIQIKYADGAVESYKSQFMRVLADITRRTN